jgi:GcrA cell cycle regulator
VFRLLAAGTVTVAQVEQAAVPARAKLASFLSDPAPEQLALARAKAATLADSSLTTAEKVCALTSNACRWPCGDPEDPDFHFCGDPVVEKPYCDHHRAMAFRPNRACSPHRVVQKVLQCP